MCGVQAFGDMKKHLSFALLLAAGICLPGFVAAHAIDTNYCDAKTYTPEVFDVQCDDRHIAFKSNGLPSADHPLMNGITATNQQFPRAHNYTFRIDRRPRPEGRKTPTEAGPIGVAVNGIPIFDPSTQGRVDPKTGMRPHTMVEGELDTCGGHAGRGDDYHYHIAPRCLIEQLGAERIDVKKQPIGFAMDGFPIHALGWFDRKNDIEDKLDDCRGFTDANGRYFYNVMHAAKWDILTCFTGRPKGFAKDEWEARRDSRGHEIVGYPLKFTIAAYAVEEHGAERCHVASGVVPREQILLTSGETKKIENQAGALFYCNSGCYGMFFEADKRASFRGRVLYFDKVIEACPAAFDVAKFTGFEAYKGPPQSHKGPQSTRK